jgi:hypothetical protein
MSTQPLEYELYRCTVHGGSKDWTITITSSGDIETLHCETGHTVKRTHIPRATFQNAPTEFNRRIREKEGKGYVYLGKAIVESNRFKLIPQGSGPAPVNADHWEIVQPLDRKQLHEKLAWVAGQLRGHVAPDTIEYDAEHVVLRCAGPQKWVIGFTDEGGIQSTGRGGGQIVRHQGLLPRLVIVYLMRSFAEAIRLSDGADGIRRPQITRDDDFLGERLFEYDRVLALGERLGLCLGRINLLDSASSHDAIWF